MNEWTVVSALVVLIGLFMTIGKPVIVLNTSITHLQDAIDNLREDIKILTGRTNDQEERIQDHEMRISILEKHHESESLK